MSGRSRTSRSMPARQSRLCRGARPSTLSPAIEVDMITRIGRSIRRYRSSSGPDHIELEIEVEDFLCREQHLARSAFDGLQPGRQVLPEHAKFRQVDLGDERFGIGFAPSMTTSSLTASGYSPA